MAAGRGDELLSIGAQARVIESWDDPAGHDVLTTQADTLGELECNIREAIEVHFDDGDASVWNS